MDPCRLNGWGVDNKRLERRWPPSRCAQRITIGGCNHGTCRGAHCCCCCCSHCCGWGSRRSTPRRTGKGGRRRRVAQWQSRRRGLHQPHEVLRSGSDSPIPFHSSSRRPVVRRRRHHHLLQRRGSRRQEAGLSKDWFWWCCLFLILLLLLLSFCVPQWCTSGGSVLVPSFVQAVGVVAPTSRSGAIGVRCLIRDEGGFIQRLPLRGDGDWHPGRVWCTIMTSSRVRCFHNLLKQW